MDSVALGMETSSINKIYMIMNVLFLTMVSIDVNKRGIYNDLMRKFKNEGHQVYIIYPNERRTGLP